MEMKRILLLSACFFGAFATPNPVITAPAELEARQNDPQLIGYIWVNGLGCMYPSYHNLLHAANSALIMYCRQTQGIIADRV